MELLPVVLTSGWASGINAYLVVLVLGLIGRFTEVAGIPEGLTRTDVLVVAAVLYLVELVFTPTNASWLNWIEAEFTALRYFTLDGSDYPSHAAQELAIARYIRWANQRATPKRRFAVNSKIRRPDYLPNVA